MDQVEITRAQLKALADKGEDITITAVNGDARMILYSRTRYIGNAREAKWMMPNGKDRKLDPGNQPAAA